MNIRTKLAQDWTEYDGKSPIWDTVAVMMDDEIREHVHSMLAPCTEADFFDYYDEIDRGELGDLVWQ